MEFISDRQILSDFVDHPNNLTEDEAIHLKHLFALLVEEWTIS